MNKILCFLVLLAAFSLPATSAYARSASAKKAIVVGKSALYGLGAGLIIGAASQVFKSETKNIFLGGSLGMYAGIAMGLYLIFSTPAPQNFEGPDTYDDFQGWQSNLFMPEEEPKLVPHDPKLVELSLLKLNF